MTAEQGRVLINLVVSLLIVQFIWFAVDMFRRR